MKWLCLLFPVILIACNQHARRHSSGDNPIYSQPSIRPLTDAIDADTANARAWFNRGNALHKLGADTLAIDDYQRAAHLDSTKAEYFSAVGNLMFDHKDISGSVHWFQKALQLNPSDPQAHLKLARLLIITKDYPKAFMEINTVLRQDVYNPECYFLKGLAYKDQKDTDKAISSFQTAISVSPEYRDADIQLGLLYTQRGNALGLQYLDNAFKLDTTDVFPLFARGKFYQQQKDYEAAKTEYHRVVLRDSHYADAFLSTGYILLQQDSVEKARRQFDIVTQTQPSNAGAWYSRGLCNEALNDKTAAAQDYRQALSFNKDYAEAKEGLRRVGSQ